MAAPISRPRGYDHDTFADDVATLIDELDLSGVTLVAHSMAGGETVRYLTRHGSGRVARIILLAPMTPMLLKTDDNPNGAPSAGFEAVWAQWKQDYPKWVADNLAPFFIPETSPAMMRWGAGLLQISIPVALACNRAMVEEDFRAEMRRIAVPTLLIHGDRDRSAPIELTGEAFGRADPRLPVPRLRGRAARPDVHAYGPAACRHPAIRARNLSAASAKLMAASPVRRMAGDRNI